MKAIICVIHMNNVAKRKATAKRVERKHACPSCDARFSFPNKLRLHIKSNHSLANACELCPERFNRFNELRTHMRRAHQIIHQCHLCAYSSSVKAELRRHVVKCHENGVRCTVDGCDATVAYNRLRRHIKEAHCSSFQNSLIVDHQMLGKSSKSENNLSEDLTEVKFSSTTEGPAITNVFSPIVSVHHNFPRVSAEPDSFETKDQIISRKISLGCTETGGYECQKCGKVFNDVYNSRRHWNRVHLKKYEKRVRLKKYACKISECTQRFSCPSKLQDHMLTVHNEDAPFDCGTCNRKFSSRASFAIHLRRYHLVSIRNVPYGFMDGISVSSVSISDEIHVTAKDNVADISVDAIDNILIKE
ncbi:C2H2-type zinc finger family protein [Acanthocheilonema viteae]